MYDTRISGTAEPLILVVNLRHTLEGGDYTRTYRFIYIDCPISGKVTISTQESITADLSVVF